MSEKPPSVILDSTSTRIDVGTISQNTTQHIIAITEDRLKLRLREYEDRIKGKSDLLAPLGVALSLVATCTTATFTSVLGLSSVVVEAAFKMSMVGAIVWTAVACWKTLRAGDTSIDYLIREIRKPKQADETHAE